MSLSLLTTLLTLPKILNAYHKRRIPLCNSTVDTHTRKYFFNIIANPSSPEASITRKNPTLLSHRLWSTWPLLNSSMSKNELNLHAPHARCFTVRTLFYCFTAVMLKEAVSHILEFFCNFARSSVEVVRDLIHSKS